MPQRKPVRAVPKVNARRKYARGNFVAGGEKHESFDWEAAVYVWHEKNVLKPAAMNPGHAAMKLTRYRQKDKRNVMVRYISWWPGEGADKGTDPQAGGRMPNTRFDRMAEMKQDEELQLVLKLQFIRIACEKLPNGPQEFKEMAAYIWSSLSTDSQNRLTDEFGCKPDFANLKLINTQPRPNQKMLGTGRLEDGKLEMLTQWALMNRYAGSDLDEMVVVKQPYAKVYVPCACLPTAIYPLDVYRRRTAWGLSMDAMNFRFRSYEDGLRKYKMQAFDDNCIGAVWECLKSGLARVITPRFRPARGVVSTLAHFRSLLPSDAINAATALSDEIVRMDKQQKFLDLRVYEYRQPVYAMAKGNACFGGDWRNYLCSLAWWRDMSSAPGVRPARKKRIDSLVAKFDQNERLLNKRHQDTVQDLLKLEAVWETRCRCVRDVKRIKTAITQQRAQLKLFAQSMKDVLEVQRIFQGGGSVPYWDRDDVVPELKRMDARYLGSQKKLLTLKKQLEATEKHGRSALTAWEKELEKYEKVRRSRAGLLIALHEAIYDYIFKHRCSQTHAAKPSPRYLAVLLLGQFVSWMYAEVAFDNLAVGFHGMNDEGPIITCSEKDKRLGDAYPNLRIRDRYAKDAAFLKAHRKRDRIL